MPKIRHLSFSFILFHPLLREFYNILTHLSSNVFSSSPPFHFLFQMLFYLLREYLIKKSNIFRSQLILACLFFLFNCIWKQFFPYPYIYNVQPDDFIFNFLISGFLALCVRVSPWVGCMGLRGKFLSSSADWCGCLWHMVSDRGQYNFNTTLSLSLHLYLTRYEFHPCSIFILKSYKKIIDSGNNCQGPWTYPGGIQHGMRLEVAYTNRVLKNISFPYFDWLSLVTGLK
jgi:hypothetical protein